MQDHLHTHRLGKWSTQKQSWNWKISDCSSYVVHPKLGSFELNHSRYKSFYGACDSVPVQCKIEADMYIKRDRLLLLSQSLEIHAEKPNTLDPLNLFFENHNLPKRMEKKIVRLMKKNRIMYGSDASVKDGSGGFTWGLMETENSHHMLAKSNAPIHGNAE